MLMAHPYNPETGVMHPPLRPGIIGLGDRPPLRPGIVGLGEEVVEPEATVPRPSARDVYDTRHTNIVAGLGQDASVADVLQKLVATQEAQRKSLRNISLWVGLVGGLTVAGVAASVVLAFRAGR